jgi:hypothetical protein
METCSRCRGIRVHDPVETLFTIAWNTQRQGDSDRDIARSGLMGRPKVAVFRLLADAQGWLKPEVPLPDDAAIAAVIGAPRRASSTISTVEPVLFEN